MLDELLVSDALWIWSEDNISEQNWTCFRKSFHLDSAPAAATARIAADSSYWLWVNGVTVIEDGGLKRGPTPDDTYYDAVEIAPYLKPGENTVAILGWYFGNVSDYYSYRSSGRGALLFDADLGGRRLVSDGSWKAERHPAFLNRRETHGEAPTYRIAEGHHFYDARLAAGFDGWEQPSFDDSAWKNAVVYGKCGCAPWNRLFKRPIPQMKYWPRTPYVNADILRGLPDSETERTVTLKMELPYNMQVQPYLKVLAPAGLEIQMLSDGTDPINTYYITREGEQEFEGYSWMSAQSITYVVPEGVVIRELAYRQSGYNAEFAGAFECEDGFFNKLWKMSLYTLYITMRDNYMDCPDRERAQWWGDSTNESHLTFYCLDPSAKALYRSGAERMVCWVKKDRSDPEGYNALQTVVPINTGYFELPFQQLAGVVGMWTYYMYTGERDFIEEMYLPALDYLKKWETGADGLVLHRSGSWDWPDWGEHHDVPAMENAWYYFALDCVLKMADELGTEEGRGFLTERMAGIAGAYDKTFWTGEYYHGSTDDGMPDDRAQALAVLAGLAGEDKYPAIIKVLTTRMESSPYMEKYVLDAMLEMGCADEALTRMKTRYSAMVNGEWTTLNEHFDLTDGTHNHAWSGGPLEALSGFVAGVAPDSPGYERWHIIPRTGRLCDIKVVVPSVRGEIRAEIKRDPDTGVCKISVNVPESTEAVIGMPAVPGRGVRVTANGEVLYESGAPAPGRADIRYCRCDGNHLYFTALPGDYTLKSEII